MIFHTLESLAMEETDAESSSASVSVVPRSLSHIYDRLEPLYKADNNFLHGMLRKIYEDLTRGVSTMMNPPKVFFSPFSS